MIQIPKLCFILMIISAFFGVLVYAQDEGKLEGRFLYEKSTNRLLSRYLVEEEHAIRMLEKEMAYRKLRFAMLQLAAENRGISFKKDFAVDIPILTFHEKDTDETNSRVKWDEFLRTGEGDEYFEKLKPAVIELGQAKLALLLAQLERLDFELLLLEERRDKTMLVNSQSPVSLEYYHRISHQFHYLIQDIKAKREEKQAAFDRISGTTIDLSTVQDDVMRIIKD
ncbi:MAG TPA: hypothetical protein PKD64_19830 [Pirellulaceae bacterium]|nr:hypothetical protein [Pirellulaceae bacterium]HMO94439.1 hypothetical protein [Pirellulaceae bacterium]